MEGCVACENEKTLLRSEGYNIDVIVVEDSEQMDRDAFAQLHMQNEMFPVVKISDSFIMPATVSKGLEW